MALPFAINVLDILYTQLQTVMFDLIHALCALDISLAPPPPIAAK